MLSSVLVLALAGFLFQSAPGSPAGTVANAAPAGLKAADQTSPAASPAKQLPPEELADIFMARKRYREALEEYQHCDLHSAVILNKIGIAYHQLMDLPNAKKYYTLSMKANSHYSEAVNNLGTIYYSQRSYRRAIHLYKKAIHISPSSATVYSNLGSAYFSIHHEKEAMDAYTRALQIDPGVFEHTSVTGVMLQDQSVQDKARFHYDMARLFAQKGMNDQAIQYIRKSLEEGFKDRKKIQEDPVFAALKDNPEFVELMKKEPREL